MYVYVKTQRNTHSNLRKTKQLPSAVASSADSVIHPQRCPPSTPTLPRCALCAASTAPATPNLHCISYFQLLACISGCRYADSAEHDFSYLCMSPHSSTERHSNPSQAHQHTFRYFMRGKLLSHKKMYILKFRVKARTATFDIARNSEQAASTRKSKESTGGSSKVQGFTG